MAGPKTTNRSSGGGPATTTQQLGSLIKSIRGIMCEGEGSDGYLRQTAQEHEFVVDNIVRGTI
ncbi:MAG: hypothetical protein GX616_15175 [Planctomycetes bacterium]|nr:hypothetical protein [Planctomycetota bacterium]